MNGVSISKTKEHTKRYPLHKHTTWEIMYYLQGEGNLATGRESLPFAPGRILIVPPETVHGSVAEEDFVNISVGGDFGHLFLFDAPVSLQDTPAGEGRVLAELIYRNRHAGEKYVAALCLAYAQFLLQQVEGASRMDGVVTQMIAYIAEHFFDPALSLTDWMRKSGYAEDYLRSVFKKATGLTPVGFLTRTRVDHARKLLEIYGHSITVAEVAEACGFGDAVYFSRRFKQLTGCSPDHYRRERCSG